jgi:hypothetical protein
MCGKVLVAVITVAGPHRPAISRAVSALKKPTNRSIPLSADSAARFLAGSTPNTLGPCRENPLSRVPSLQPMSTTRSSSPKRHRATTVSLSSYRCAFNVSDADEM